MKNSIEEKQKLGIYLHIPFCIRKCKYCDFLSFPAGENEREQYVRCLLQDIDTFRTEASDYEADTIFIGGGTPSVLSESQLNVIMEKIRQVFFGGQMIPAGVEVTMEANPGTIDFSALCNARKAGINRLSLGLQSANNKELALLGRIHTWEQFVATYQLAREAGFTNINVDVISALPGQMPHSYEETLKKVLMLKPEHISSYGLIIEEGTPFYEIYGEEEKRRQKGLETKLLPSEETERLMYERTRELLKEHRYERYEISNYAIKGFSCRHNIGYWTGKDYIGFGLGAASLVKNTRFVKTREFQLYLKHDFERYEQEVLSIKEQMEEFMFLGLRRMCGVSEEEFAKRFYVKLQDIYKEKLEKLQKEELILYMDGNIRLTEKGISVSNYVFEAFMQDE